MIALAGVSYRTAPVEVREGLAFTAGELAELLPALKTRFGATAVLSTCNRTEVYLSGDVHAADAIAVLAQHKRATSILRQAQDERGNEQRGRGGVGSPEIDSSQIYCLERADAVRHLLRVAAGLDSMILGEVQILGQVRGALLAAERAASADALLTRLFQSAIATGRKARTTAGLGRFAASVSTTAVALAQRICGDLRQCSVLVVSAGEAGKLTAQGLRNAGAGRIIVTSRTMARAATLAGQLGGTTLLYDRLGDGVATADIVISATGSRGFQIDKPMIEQAMTGRSARPLLLVDLAVPRDIDPAVCEISGVQLHDIDDLQLVGGDGQGERLHAVEEAERLVEIEVGRFLGWWQSRRAVPTIAALRGQADAIRRAELAKTLDRLPNLSDEERGRIDALTAAIVNKLLHQPITRLKTWETDARYLDAVTDLFALTAGAAD